MNKTGPSVPFDELSHYEFDPHFFSPASRIEFLSKRRNGESGELTNPEDVSNMSNVTLSLTEEEREEVLANHLEVIRLQSYEEMNEHRERRGLQPWYILTKEELDLVGLCLPYDLAINPRHRYVKEKIKREGQRIKELRAKGIAVTPWSTWKEAN
jgi:hypothetical protein